MLAKVMNSRSTSQLSMSDPSFMPSGQKQAVLAERFVICGAGRQMCEQRPLNSRQWLDVSGWRYGWYTCTTMGICVCKDVAMIQ